MAKKRRPRRSAGLAARKLASKERKLAHDKDRLFALSPGGSRLRPMRVVSVAVIESRASSIPCPQCGGRLHIDTHEVDPCADVLLRVISAHCTSCAGRRQLWFRVERTLAN